MNVFILNEIFKLYFLSYRCIVNELAKKNFFLKSKRNISNILKKDFFFLNMFSCFLNIFYFKQTFYEKMHYLQITIILILLTQNNLNLFFLCLSINNI